MKYDELVAKAEKEIKIVREMRLGRAEVDALCSTTTKLIAASRAAPEKQPEKKEEKKKERRDGGPGTAEPGA